MVDDTTSTQTKRLTFSDARRLTSQAYWMALYVAAVSLKAWLFGGVIVSSIVTLHVSGSVVTGRSRKITVEEGGRTVTMTAFFRHVTAR